MAKVIVTMEAERNSYTGQPGSTKNLYIVSVDGVPRWEMGPGNSFGLKPGGSIEAEMDGDGKIQMPGGPRPMTARYR